jgi:hypothetical protein
MRDLRFGGILLSCFHENQFAGKNFRSRRFIFRHLFFHRLQNNSAG